eukprot:m.139026 g.139026  ORF g.139026 m.139026 type:complete len:59 (+) comp18515_c0_seq1:3-179(+)
MSEMSEMNAIRKEISCVCDVYVMSMAVDVVVMLVDVCLLVCILLLLVCSLWGGYINWW